MNRMNRVFFTMLLLFCFILTGLPLLSAQETDEEEFTLEEITVTAQKRVENQQKVAISMETISGSEMTEMGKNNIDEILSDISSVIINKAGDGMRVSLRGIAETESIQKGQVAATPTVAVNIDGAYNGNNNAAQNLFDLERVEVLVGPQSTMYASNSPGGIVNVVTAAPKTDRYSASGSFEYGSYNLSNMTAIVNAPILQDKVALRLATNWTKRDSYISGADTTSAEDTKTARLKALYQPNDKLSFTVTGNWSKRGGGGGMGGSVQIFANQDDPSDPWVAGDTDATGGINNTEDNITKGLSGEIALETGFGALTITPSYSRSNSKSFQTNTDGEQYHGISKNTQKSLEARMTSSSDFTLFKWILGANYYKGDDMRGTDYVVASTIDESNTNSQKTKALFANITYPVTDAFRTTVGYRRSWDKTTNIEIAQNGPGVDFVAGTPTVSGQEYTSPDYKFGIEYDLGDNMMIYADRSTSYRVNGLGMTNSDGDAAPPEKLVAYTVGSKNRFLNNKLQVNGSIFYYDYKNKSASNSKQGTYDEADYAEYEYDFDNDDKYISEDVSVHDQNSQSWGNFRSYGADVSADWMLTAQDKLSLSVSYLNAKWTKLSFSFVYSEIWPDENYDGVTNTYSPTMSSTISYEHNFMLPNGGTLTPHVDGQYQSSYELAWLSKTATDEVKSYAHQEAHTMWNSSMMYADPSGKWTLNGYVKNLFNYAVKTSYMDMGQDSYALTISDPRTYGAVLSVKF